MPYSDVNQAGREEWLRKTLARLPEGARLLDAGAGEGGKRRLCSPLRYVSQDFCQYDGVGDGKGLQTGQWDTRGIDIVSDITSIPEEAGSFDCILCSEVLEHLPDPGKALDEFARLLKPGGVLVLTAPFASLVHFAPFHYCSGFSRYWYQHHLGGRGFDIAELTPNGDWFACCRQELLRLGGMSRGHGDWSWPLAYLLAVLGWLYFKVRGGAPAAELACFGWHCVATKRTAVPETVMAGGNVIELLG
jgi:SAM-dependent methyltransferase